MLMASSVASDLGGRIYLVKTCCVLEGGGLEEFWPIVSLAARMDFTTRDKESERAEDTRKRALVSESAILIPAMMAEKKVELRTWQESVLIGQWFRLIHLCIEEQPTVSLMDHIYRPRPVHMLAVVPWSRKIWPSSTWPSPPWPHVCDVTHPTFPAHPVPVVASTDDY